MSDTPDPLGTHLNRLAERTRNGEIQWRRSARQVLTANRTTASGTKTMLVQRVPSDRVYREPFDRDAEYDFQFQVVNTQDGRIELSLDNRRQPALLSSLRDLYDAAEQSDGGEQSLVNYSRRLLEDLAES